MGDGRELAPLTTLQPPGHQPACPRDNPNAAYRLATSGHMESFRLLLKRGAKVTSAHNGGTLLMEAVDKNRADFVSFLLGHTHTGMAVDVTQRDEQGNNALFYAAAAGNLDICQQLLQAGCPVENDQYNRNVLMQAALHGHTHIVQFIFNNSKALNIDVHQKDSDGRNLLFYCIEGGHVELLKALLDSGLILSPDNRGRTNLMQAARQGHLPITRYLLDNALTLNLDINAMDQHGENALFYAARSGSLEVVAAMLTAGLKVRSNRAGVSVPAQCLSEGQLGVAGTVLSSASNMDEAVNGKDTKGRTVLQHFVEKDDIANVTEYGQYYQSDHDCDLTGCTLLMAACKHSANMDLIRYLVHGLKVNVSAVDMRKRSALFYAIESANLPAVDFILDHIAHCDSDHNGLSPLHVATVTGNHFIVETLLKSKFGKSLVNRVDRHGRNELHYAAMHGYTALVELLENHDSNLDTEDQQGLTPSMYACAHGRYAALATLLRKGADPEILDKKGRNAIHHCFLGTNPSLRCCKLLVKYGADVDCRDSEGVTSLMRACHTCAETNIAIIRYLITSGADPVLQDNLGKDAFDHCPFHAEYVKALMREQTEISQSERDALQLNHDQLVERVELASCLRGLLRSAIFTKTLNFEVMKRPAPERVDRLLELLTYRGARAFRAFCAVLRECGEAELAFTLLKQSYRKTEEVYW